MNKPEEIEAVREETRRRVNEQTADKREKDRLDQERRDINKQKAMKSLQKRNQKSFWEKNKDYFAYGALGAVVLFILISNFTGDRRKLADIPVNEEDFIIQHNDANPPFKLGANDHFQGHTLANVKEWANNRFSTKKTISKCNPKSIEDVAISNDYNFYKAHAHCRGTEQNSKLSASYAETPLSVFRNRNCKAGGDPNFVPALNYLFNCDIKFNTGSKGGYLANSVDFMMKHGLINEHCWNDIKAAEGECPAADKIKTCSKEYVENYCVFETVDEIKKEIQKNGPVVSFMPAFRDFLIYKNGLYEQGDKFKVDGMFFVKIVGWETAENGSQYWLVDPLWGRTWGDDGLARVAIGTPESLLDQVGLTLYPTAQEKSQETTEEA